MDKYKQQLNEQQYDVVKNGDGRALVLAGAGSGKTRTIVYRVAYLLEEKNVAPEEILLVTFTNKAADEMTTRVREMTSLDQDLPWAGTFHSIGYRILKEQPTKLNYDSNFTVLDSSDSEKLIKKCIEKLGVNTKDKFPKASTLQSIISFARNSEDTIENVLDLKYPKYFEHLETIEHIADQYEQKKKQANAMDFDDLLVNLIRLMQNHSDIRSTYSDQFKYVLADEYQDTNQLQATILELFSETHENLLVVGDDAQSIYSFRAADVDNILEFEDEYENVSRFKLETNYRSTPAILQLANETIKKNINQHEKKLESVKETNHSPRLEELSDQKKEAKFIADKVERLNLDGVNYSEISTLFRASHHSQSLEMELNQRGIPYEFRGGLRFFDRAHIKDILAYMKVLLNPKDVSAWDRVLTQHTGIGPKTSSKLIDRIQSLSTLEDIRDVGSDLNSRAKPGWSNFISIWRQINQAKTEGPQQIIKNLKDSEYKEYLENEYENSNERIKDIKQLSFTAASLIEDDDEARAALQNFLAEATMQQKFTADDSKKDKMVLSTVHQAKGLEWKSVFIMNLAEEHFPNQKALDSPQGIEEERRLFYVALTRAKEHLYLTYPLTSPLSNKKFQRPSRFVEEVRHLLEDEEEMQAEESDFEYELEQDSKNGFLTDIDNL